jgi:hypothetical protein
MQRDLVAGAVDFNDSSVVVGGSGKYGVGGGLFGGAGVITNWTLATLTFCSCE